MRPWDAVGHTVLGRFIHDLVEPDYYQPKSGLPPKPNEKTQILIIRVSTGFMSTK